MKLFSEKVSPTLTNSPLNILQVKDHEEIFFGVYEIEINKNKYPVEKISEHNGNPVVSVPVTLRGEKKMFPFVLSKGKFEILFNENNTLDSDDTFVSTPLITESVVSDPIDIFVEDVETLSKVDNNKKKILSQIKRAKREASEYASKIKKQKIDEANVVIDSKKKALDKMIEEARSSLVDEFISISNKIKVEFIDENDNRFGEIKETIDNKIIDLSNSLSDGLKNEFSNSAIQLESKVKELVGAIHLAIKPKINKEFEDLSNKLDKKVKNVSNKIDEKVQNIEKSIEHVEINLDSKFSSKVDSIIESNVELNNKINKGVNKALSRVGNVDKHIEELVENFNSKISNAEKNILEYYTDKIELLEKNAFDFNENTRKFFVESIEESRNNLIQEIRKLKDSKPIEYIIESKDENIKIKSDDLLKNLDKKINKKIDDEVTRLRKYISVYGGGGGTVAMQFADGGTMNGDLNINGDLFVSGTTRINELSANRIYTTHLEALSANITVIDIKQYELSGFNVTGNVTIQGSISASQYLGLAEVATSGDYNDLSNLPTLDTGAYLPLSGGTMDDNALIKFDNDARLQEGTTSAGANGGIALKCSIDYELKWEAGRLYVMEQDGFTIRVEQYGFTTVPTATDDATKGYIVGSRRILDSGVAYTCTDAATGVAVWRNEFSGNASVTVWNYRSETGIISGYPADGRLLWNNAIQTDATEINVSHKNDVGEDIELILGFIQEGQEIFIQDRDVSANFQIWRVSGTPVLFNGNTATAYYTYPLTLISSGGTGTTGFPDNHRLFLGMTQSLALHAPTHAEGGSDPITPADIGAVGLTGNQTISGVKTFLSVPTISGNQVATVVDPVRTTLSGNGVLSSFAISGASGLVNPSALIVAIDGAMQEPTVDYAVGSGQITFTSPLPNGSKAVVISPTNTLQVTQMIPADGSVTSAKLANDLTLTNATINGTANFTSTTRPTSSGTGTPAATSLITLTDAVDFITNPNNIIVRDDFINGGSTSQTIGDLGWFSSSDGGGTGSSITGPLAVFPNIGARILTCGNATNAGQVIYLPSITSLLTYAGWEFCFVVKLNQTTDCDLIVGLTKDNGAIGIGKFGGISFGARYSSTTDTDFMFYSKNTNLTFATNDASNYAISSGVAAGTTYNTFRIRSTVAGALQMSINGGSFVAVDTSLITTTGIFIPFFYIATRTTTSKSIDVDFFSMKIQGVAR